MTEKIKYFISVVLGGIVLFLFGINTGKKKQKEKIEKEVIKNVKKAKNIDNLSNSDISKLQDKYE